MIDAAQTRAILADHFGVVYITDDQSLTDDLGADSLGVLELVMDLETAFGIDIPDDRMEHVKTVADVVALVEGLIPAPTPADGGTGAK